MARPERNEVDYFPFYCKEGRVMFIIEQRYGNDGYATWIKLLRSLAVTNFHYLDLSSDFDVEYLSTKCRVTSDVLIEIIELLVLSGEFDKELWEQKKVVWSEKFIDSIQDAYSRRNNKPLNRDVLIHKLGGLCTTITPLDSEKTYNNPQSKVKESKVKESKVKESKVKEIKELLFDKFWKIYDKKVGRKDVESKWMKIDIDTMRIIIDKLPEYIKATPDNSFRKNPLTYLNGKHWEDEIIFKQQNNYGNNSTNQQPRRTLAEQADEVVRRYNERYSGKDATSADAGTTEDSNYEIIE